MLATSGATGPSVLQVRAQDVFPESLGAQVVRVLLEQTDALESGAIVTIDEIAARVRILPIRRRSGSEGLGGGRSPRAARGDRGKFERAMAKVRDTQPEEGDA